MEALALIKPLEPIKAPVPAKNKKRPEIGVLVDLSPRLEPVCDALIELSPTRQQTVLDLLGDICNEMQAKDTAKDHEEARVGQDTDASLLLDLEGPSEETPAGVSSGLSLNRALTDLTGLEFAGGTKGGPEDPLLQHSLALIQCAMAGLDPETRTRLRLLVDDVKDAHSRAALPSPATMAPQTPTQTSQPVRQEAASLLPHSPSTPINPSLPTLTGLENVQTPQLQLGLLSSFHSHRSPNHSPSSTEPGFEPAVTQQGNLSPVKKSDMESLLDLQALSLSESPKLGVPETDMRSALSWSPSASDSGKQSGDLSNSIHAPSVVEEHQLGEAGLARPAPSLPPESISNVVLECEGSSPQTSSPRRPSAAHWIPRTIVTPPLQPTPRSDPNLTAGGTSLTRFPSGGPYEGAPLVQVGTQGSKPTPTLAPGRWGLSELEVPSPISLAPGPLAMPKLGTSKENEPPALPKILGPLPGPLPIPLAAKVQGKEDIPKGDDPSAAPKTLGPQPFRAKLH